MAKKEAVLVAREKSIAARERALETREEVIRRREKRSASVGASIDPSVKYSFAPPAPSTTTAATITGISLPKKGAKITHRRESWVLKDKKNTRAVLQR